VQEEDYEDEFEKTSARKEVKKGVKQEESELEVDEVGDDYIDDDDFEVWLLEKENIHFNINKDLMRDIVISDDAANLGFSSNYIKTTKYNMFSYLPLSILW